MSITRDLERLFPNSPCFQSFGILELTNSKVNFATEGRELYFKGKATLLQRGGNFAPKGRATFQVVGRLNSMCEFIYLHDA